MQKEKYGQPTAISYRRVLAQPPLLPQAGLPSLILRLRRSLAEVQPLPVTCLPLSRHSQAEEHRRFHFLHRGEEGWFIPTGIPHGCSISVCNCVTSVSYVPSSSIIWELCCGFVHFAGSRATSKAWNGSASLDTLLNDHFWCDSDWQGLESGNLHLPELFILFIRILTYTVPVLLRFQSIYFIMGFANQTYRHKHQMYLVK